MNNCLGLRNYKYFLVFILFYFLFLLMVTVEVFRNIADFVEDNAS